MVNPSLSLMSDTVYSPRGSTWPLVAARRIPSRLQYLPTLHLFTSIPKHRPYACSSLRLIALEISSMFQPHLASNGSVASGTIKTNHSRYVRPTSRRQIVNPKSTEPSNNIDKITHSSTRTTTPIPPIYPLKSKVILFLPPNNNSTKIPLLCLPSCTDQTCPPLPLTLKTLYPLPSSSILPVPKTLA